MYIIYYTYISGIFFPIKGVFNENCKKQNCVLECKEYKRDKNGCEICDCVSYPNAGCSVSFSIFRN